MTKVVFGYQSRLLASQLHRSSGCGLGSILRWFCIPNPVLLLVCVSLSMLLLLLREADLSISMFKSACGD